MQYLRKKLRGWDSNLRGKKRRNKNRLLSSIHSFEQQKDNNTITDQDIETWQSCQEELYLLYLDEEKYWQQRSKLKWILEEDLNTIFFSYSCIS